MNQNKLSSRVYTLIKSALAAGMLPLLFIYIMIAKPDYRIMNAMAHVVVPVATLAGDAITWPIRAIGNMVDNIHEMSVLRAENEELRAQLDAAHARDNTCDIVIAENQKLARELNMVETLPHASIIADVIFDNRAFDHDTFLINRGAQHGIEPGMVAVSSDGMLVGTVIDSGVHFARVRTLVDSDTNIAVRVAGAEVYGFMQGNGTTTPQMRFFSDPEFQASPGVKLVTSNISGVLPGGIYVGEMTDNTNVKIMSPKKLTRVIILKFDTANEYR